MSASDGDCEFGHARDSVISEGSSSFGRLSIVGPIAESIMARDQDVASRGSIQLAACRDEAREGLSGDARIAVIEGRIFLRECIRRGMQSAFSVRVLTYSSIDEMARDGRSHSIRLVVLSSIAQNEDETGNLINAVNRVMPGAAVIVLADRLDLEMTRTVIGLGAKAYIPMSMGFEIAVEAFRFVLAGGTYVPAEYFLGETVSYPSAGLKEVNALTARELVVIQAIRQGKSNKVIAYELNMCESTVKVHVRHIMKKLDAKNRTAVAVQATDVLSRAGLRGDKALASTGNEALPV